MINKIFENIGMTNREAKIYLACLKLHNPNISDLQKQTNLSRSTVYYSIDLLQKNDIIFSKKINDRTVYEVIDPEELKKKIENKINEFSIDAKQFEMAIPDLKQFAKKGNLNLKMVKGFENLAKILQEVYANHKNSTVKVFGTKPKDYNKKYFNKSFNKTINYRLKNGVFLKGISPITENKINVRNQDTDQLREGRFLPDDKFNFESEIFIFDDVVLVVSENIENEVNTIYFNDDNYVKTMNMIFELAWEAAEKYDREVVAEYEEKMRSGKVKK